MDRLVKEVATSESLAQIGFSDLAGGFHRGTDPWFFYVLRLHQGADLFETTTTNTASLGAALLIVPSAFAERKIRLWLVLGAVSLLFFFVSSTGEIAI